MAQLQYNELLPKKTIIIDGDPYIVLSSQTSKKDRQKASNRVKLKNLRTGNVIDRTFHQSDVLPEAEMDKRELTFLYSNRGEYWFCPVGKPADRMSFPEELVGAQQGQFMKENSVVEALVFDDQIIGITLPIKVDLRVVEAMPAVKGNTTQGANKEVKLETGATVMAPMFINEGDIVRINTETGEYSERVEKA